MRRAVIVIAAVAGVWACGTSTADRQMAVDTLTRRQKDSLISTMPIPGSGAVGRALESADRLNARTEAHDTIR
jgi:hypothetical protein